MLTPQPTERGARHPPSQAPWSSVAPSMRVMVMEAHFLKVKDTRYKKQPFLFWKCSVCRRGEESGLPASRSWEAASPNTCEALSLSHGHRGSTSSWPLRDLVFILFSPHGKAVTIPCLHMGRFLIHTRAQAGGSSPRPGGVASALVCHPSLQAPWEPAFPDGGWLCLSEREPLCPGWVCDYDFRELGADQYPLLLTLCCFPGDSLRSATEGHV